MEKRYRPRSKRRINQKMTLHSIGGAEKACFLIGEDSCSECCSNRQKLSFWNLTIEEKHHWIKCPYYSSISYYLYCSSCKEYTAILEVLKN